MPYKPVPEPRKGIRKHLTMEEWRALYAAAQRAGEFEHVLVRLMYETALRAAEPGLLRLDHLKRLTHEPPQLYVPRGKGSTVGWVVITQELADMLRAWVKYQYQLGETITVGELCGNRPAYFVFPGTRYKGQRRGITRNSVWATIKELCEHAEVDPSVAHPHAIRHARVQHLFEAAEEQGLDPRTALKTVAKLVGHKSAEMAWEHYVSETGAGKKIADAVLREAFE
jgi:integrase